MSKTVVGLFSTMAQANEVKQTLVSEGFESSEITVVANDGEGESYSGASTSSSQAPGIGHKISSFFSNLTGGDDKAHEHYASGVNQGRALLAARVDDDEAAEVASLLNEYGALNIDGNYEQAAASGTPVYGEGEEVSGRTAIPIVEEELQVGKREVDRGGVRVYSHVTERPVDADVTLREESINVERRAVNRPATAADFAAGSGAVLELNATGEEAVVGKTARVVEEVLVGKESSTRTQQIHDSVRKTEVDVEELAGASTVPGGTTYAKDRM